MIKLQTIMDYVNPKLQQQCPGRQISAVDAEGYLNDDAYEKPTDEKQLCEDILNMAINTPPNLNPEQEVTVNGRLFMLINAYQKAHIENAIEMELEEGNTQITGDKILMGAFATDDETIFFVKNEKEARALTAVPKRFKDDIAGILELKAENATAIYSLIGAQFGFEENVYYKAPKINQYEFPTNKPELRKNLFFEKIYDIKEIYKKNKEN